MPSIAANLIDHDFVFTHLGKTYVADIKLGNLHDQLHSVLDTSRIAWGAISADLGKLTAAEWSFVHHQLFLHAERTLRKQELIQVDLSKAKKTGDLALYHQCRRDLRKLNRQHWSVGSILKSKVLVKRKGTERSRSKSGAQTICTHTNPIFEESCEQRWLLGLAVEVSRAANARNRVKHSAPFTAQTEALRLTTKYFADAKTDVRQQRFRTQIRTAALFGKRKQVGDGRSGGSVGLPTRGPELSWLLD